MTRPTVIEAWQSSAAPAPQWLSFQISGQHYAAPLTNVSEVIREGELTPVPGAAADLLGIRHLRGRIVPVMDGRLRLELPVQPGTDPSDVRIVLLCFAEQLVGLRVDAVGALIHAEAGELLAPPPQRPGRDQDPLTGVIAWQGVFVALLDVGLLCRLTGRADHVA